MSAHQKNQSSSSNATAPPLGYVNREDARNLEAGTADCMLVMRKHVGRFERPVYSRPEQANVGETGFGAVVPTAYERAGRIYVAGPMSGIADFNFPVFNAAAAMLRYLGWTVENPAEHALADNLEWSDYMAYDLTRLGLCGAIYLLPGWSKSKSATIEKNLAAALGMDIQFDPNAEQGLDVEPVPQERVMSNQAKRLSDCPAERLAQCRSQVIPPAGGAAECALCASLGDQCVTCEEAEFAVWADRHFASADYQQTTAGVYVQDWMRHSFSAWQARGAHVTRLQAEVSALQQRLIIADKRVDDLQAEAERLRHGPCELIYGDELPNQGIPGTSFQRLNALANEGE